MTPPSKLVSYTSWIFWHPQGMFCLLVFSAIGRFSHGLPVLDAETFKTSDPFIDGWLLCAYLLGRFGDDAEVRTGVGKAAMLWPNPNPGCWDTVTLHADATLYICSRPRIEGTFCWLLIVLR